MLATVKRRCACIIVANATASFFSTPLFYLKSSDSTYSNKGNVPMFVCPKCKVIEWADQRESDTFSGNQLRFPHKLEYFSLLDRCSTDYVPEYCRCIKHGTCIDEPYV